MVWFVNIFLSTFLALTNVVLAAILVNRRLKESYRFWLKQNVPFVPPLPFLGSMEWGSMKKPLQETEVKWYNRYGRIYGRFEATKPVISIGEPDIVKDILATHFHTFPNRRDLKFHDPVMDNTLFVLEGEAWSSVRKIVSPAFTTKRLKGMFSLLNECSDLLVERLSEVNNEIETVHCQEFFGGFVLSAIARCAFGMNISAIRDPKNIFVEKSKKLFQEAFSWRTYITILCPSLMKIFRLNLLNPETTSFYRETIIQVIEERKRLNVIREDFLQMMIDAEDTNNNGADAVCETSDCKNEKPKTVPIVEKKGLTHDEVLSQSVTFFIAGFDSTTSLLSHLTYRLAMNPLHQERVVEELKRALAKHNRMCYEALNEMNFLSAMMRECLRMCPAMVRHERRAEKDYVIKSKNIFLKKGTIVSIPVYAMHHDPAIYKNPEEFDPERFIDLKQISRFDYLPFGNGQRICVAMRFVHLQVQLCIAKLLMKFEILPAPTTPDTLGFCETRNVLSVNKVEVCLRARELC